MGYASRDNFQYGVEWFYRDFFPAAGISTRNLVKTIRMEQDSDFTVEKMCYLCDPGVLTAPLVPQNTANRSRGQFNVRIRDSTTGRYWSSRFTNIDTVAGYGALPFVLPTPKLMVANSEITIELEQNGSIPDQTQGTNFTLTLNFIGNKLFRR